MPKSAAPSGNLVAPSRIWGRLLAVQSELQNVLTSKADETLHTNMAGDVPDNIDKAAYAGAPPPSTGVEADE
jgi:hypothetical protein